MNLLLLLSALIAGLTGVADVRGGYMRHADPSVVAVALTSATESVAEVAPSAVIRAHHERASTALPVALYPTIAPARAMVRGERRRE
ncbi:MAG: hypothetical protein K2P79_11765 [Sphingomonas sp.]|nr:hypothetical protein [Sphingomonas sp.]